jgi:hypothetical protein
MPKLPFFFFVTLRLCAAVAYGRNHASCSWGKPPRPHWLPKTALPCLCVQQIHIFIQQRQKINIKLEEKKSKIGSSHHKIF